MKVERHSSNVPEPDTRLERIAKESDEYDQGRIERWVALAKKLFEDEKDRGTASSAD